MSEDDFDVPADIFEEPQDFRPPSPQPTVESYERVGEGIVGPRTLVVNLPPKHSLWAHRLWNAGKSMTQFLDQHQDWYKGKTVLELGSAASLPSLVCAMNGAKRSISTDYPDPQLVKNITKNCTDNCPELLETGFLVRGYIWGDDVTPLLEANEGKFDLILLADLIFNHTEHERMLKTCLLALKDDGVVLTTFSHHVPKWADRDLKFFEIAQDLGFASEELYSEKWTAMFPDDKGDLDMRQTVRCFKLWKSKEQ
ncbi:hypothetical protein EDD86DRAFT_207774 [Gorgonomyces haynaldii]|nr:hypothetical protein EDD86DRAFT_207774 [Gorgonomyces haynaldii]